VAFCFFIHLLTRLGKVYHSLAWLGILRFHALSAWASSL
jgi:hypothetical protein